MADAGDAARMRGIIEQVRAAGVTVREMPGWESRGATWVRSPRGCVDHHDASTVKSGEWGALGVIVTGRPGIPPPLSQFQVARCLDGVPKVAVIACGRANHAGLGGPYNLAGTLIPANSGNSWLYGIEKANDGLGEPYTVAALYALTALTSAIADVCGISRDAVLGHKEWAPGRKSDPQYRMWRCREETVAFQPGRLPTPPPGTPITPVVLPENVQHHEAPGGVREEDDMVRLMNFGDGHMWVVDVGAKTKWQVQGPGHFNWLRALGIPEVQGVQGGGVGDLFTIVDPGTAIQVVKNQQTVDHYLVGPGFVSLIPTPEELAAAVTVYGEPQLLDAGDITRLQMLMQRVRNQLTSAAPAPAEASS